MLIAYPNLSLCLPKNIFYQKNIKLEKKCPLQANKRKLWGKCDFIKNIFTPVFRERKYLTKYSPVHPPPPLYYLENDPTAPDVLCLVNNIL